MPARLPEDVDRMFGEYVNAGDIDALVALYEPDGVLVEQDGRLATGHDAIRASLGAIIAAKAQIRMNVVKVVRSGDDLAMLYNDWSLSAVVGDGEPVEIVGKALELVRRQIDGTWLFAIDDPYART